MADSDEAQMMKAVPRLGRSSRLADDAHRAIKHLIITNEFRGGDVISESALATQLGISRSPVRQAIVNLEQEGFVEIEPWRPPRVVEVTPRVVREVFGVREPLEGYAARESMPAISDDELDSWDARLDEIAKAMDAGDVEPFNAVEKEYHDLFRQRSNNRLLSEFLGRLEDHLDRIRNVYRDEIFTALPSKRHELDEHRQVLVAVRARDADAVERAMSQHVSNVATRLLALMEKDRDDPD